MWWWWLCHYQDNLWIIDNGSDDQVHADHQHDDRDDDRTLKIFQPLDNLSSPWMVAICKDYL